MSYSQNGEDLELINRYGLEAFTRKAYIELGALDGIRYSNTKLLEDNYGWTGVLIEPNPVAFKELQDNRPNNINLNHFVSNSADPIVFDYFENPDLAAVSSSRESRPSHVQSTYFTANENNQWLTDEVAKIKTIAVQPITLTEACNNSPFDSFGLLSLDVEGHELAVLQSYDWIKPISLILVEHNESSDIPLFLAARGYSKHNDIANNSVYVNEKLGPLG